MERAASKAADHIDSRVEVTEAAMDLEFDFNVPKPIMSGDDEIIMYTAAGALFLGLAFAAKAKLTSKADEEMEFEAVDDEKPQPTESKKAIKKTLKDVLKKNNAKATLMN